MEVGECQSSAGAGGGRKESIVEGGWKERGKDCRRPPWKVSMLFEQPRAYPLQGNTGSRLLRRPTIPGRRASVPFAGEAARAPDCHSGMERRRGLASSAERTDSGWGTAPNTPGLCTLDGAKLASNSIAPALHSQRTSLTITIPCRVRRCPFDLRFSASSRIHHSEVRFADLSFPLRMQDADITRSPR